ncbi:MAG: D-2-hydroxyacid dehydrogenase [Candidatus Latescibacterota bacterium]|nr:D-2-hydroxyacid dehydrogenase [Candidatus Latescibacterota bacterium]
MKIVILDGYTLNPGDLSWDGLSELGELKVHEHSTADQIVDRARDAEIVLTNKTPFTGDTLGQLPDVRYIGVLATGYNIVDVDAATTRSIPVTNVPTYGTASVAQAAIAHVLNLTQRIADHARAVNEDRWATCRDFSFWDYPLVELEGLAIGIIGLGRIGRRTAEMARAFGMKTIAYSRTRTPVDGIEFVDLNELFRRSDVVSLHCPLTPETERIVNGERLAMMKPSAFLINTSRGPLVDEEALREALEAERIAGAGLDVMTVEPPAAQHPLYGVKNCYITPHNAWATHAARHRLLNTVVDNVRAFIAGSPQNVVNDVT